MKHTTHHQISLIAALILQAFSQASTAIAAALPLAEFPAGSAYRVPAPNVILSVDDSGSMGGMQGGMTRMNGLRQALLDTFQPANMPDDSIRLAYQAMWNCNFFPHVPTPLIGGAPSTNANCANFGTIWNTMRPLKGTTDVTENSHRGQFYRWINTLRPNGGTPSHRMMYNAGEYLRLHGAHSPWNASPGSNDPNPITCRRSYHIFMTDGGWNQFPLAIAPGNVDAQPRTLPGPDNKVYDPSAPESRIYADNWGDAFTSTLSDLAFHYWATDLQPGINNEGFPIIKHGGNETLSFGANSMVVPEYWNPKNNPSKWQNMTTFTIGYGAGATGWPNIGTNPIFTAGPLNDRGMYGQDYRRTYLGQLQWRDPIHTTEDPRAEELWHMAINSRGKYYPATTPAELTNAFKEIISTIVADNTKPITSATSANRSLTLTDNYIYRAGYNADGWTGYVLSNHMSAATGIESPHPGWGTNPLASPTNMTTAHKLDALTNLSDRFIFTYNPDLAPASRSVVFDWVGGSTQLSAAQKAILDSVDAKGAERVQYLRGDRTKEASQGGYFRDRKSRQGDIVNSSVWYSDAPASLYDFLGYRAFANTNKDRLPMIYVGGNDGMLHGFSALTGDERMAYVPQGIYPKLPELTDTNYFHKYYVDGSPFTGDMYDSSTSEWKTYLAGTLGAGGKGYFVLDVSRPGEVSNLTNTDFAPATVNKLVVMDKTDGGDADIGHIFGKPVVAEKNNQQALQITRMNDGRWAVVFGNGYNSTNERPVLLIQYLDGAKELKKISPVPVSTPPAAPHADAVQNGLSTPQFLDVNGDAIPDFIYAGDLRGNLWKFDLSDSDPNLWGVAFSGNPLFIATDTGGNRQPITAPPVLRLNTVVGGMMVAFGTGRNVTENDRTDTSTQTVYSVLDNTRYELDATPSPNKGKVKVKASPAPTPVTGRSQLMMQTTLTPPAGLAGRGVSTGRTFWALNTTAAIYDCAGVVGPCTAVKGWYYDLPVAGERVLDPIDFYQGGNIMEITSLVPASGGNVFSAGETCLPSPTAQKTYRTLIHVSRGNPPRAQVMDTNGDSFYNSGDSNASRMTAATTEVRISTKTHQLRIGGDGKTDKLLNLPQVIMRPSWRQLQ